MFCFGFFVSCYQISRVAYNLIKVTKSQNKSSDQHRFFLLSMFTLIEKGKR